jgi:aryl-alcohol dehydrogenase-like predicted oxidoreductase
MDERTFGRSDQHASVIGLGTWQLGADWGDVDDKEALAVLEAAAESGVTFFDTADVYGDGRSEQTISTFLASRPDLHVLVATKMGRRVEQIPQNYVLDNFREWNDRSRRNLGVDRLDLVQLHCPSTPATRCSTPWTPSSRRSASPRTESAWRRARRPSPRSPGRTWPACRSSSTRSA